MEVSGDNYMVSKTPEYKLRRLNRDHKMTKFRTDFNGTSAADAASETWNKIQKLKDK